MTSTFLAPAGSSPNDDLRQELVERPKPIRDGAEVLPVVCDEDKGGWRIAYVAGGEPVRPLTGEYGRIVKVGVSLSGTGLGRGSRHSQILPKAITRRIIAVSSDRSNDIFGLIGLGARLGSL
jgi:hypothetical protein